MFKYGIFWIGLCNLLVHIHLVHISIIYFWMKFGLIMFPRQHGDWPGKYETDSAKRNIIWRILSFILDLDQPLV